MNKRNLFVVVLTAALLLSGVFAALQAPAVQASPNGAVNSKFTQLLSGSYNATRAGLGKDSAVYSKADCYLIVSGMTAVNTTTVKLQHSGDGSNWFDLVSFTAAATNTTAFTTTSIYGSYLRAYATLANTATVSLNAHCVLKD
jgi:hypothetical protein